MYEMYFVTVELVLQCTNIDLYAIIYTCNVYLTHKPIIVFKWSISIPKCNVQSPCNLLGFFQYSSGQSEYPCLYFFNAFKYLLSKNSS